MIAYAKSNPGKLNFASSGNGAFDHVPGGLFKMMAGVNMRHVPYRGAAPALTDLLGGQVQVMFNALPASIEYIRTGKLRALAGPEAPTMILSLSASGDAVTLSFVPPLASDPQFGTMSPRPTVMPLTSSDPSGFLTAPLIANR